MMHKLILLRHGRVIGTRKSFYWLDRRGLSDAGIREARRAGQVKAKPPRAAKRAPNLCRETEIAA